MAHRYGKSFRHFTFQFPARSRHFVESEGFAFPSSWREAVRSIGHTMKCDGVLQLLVQARAKRSPAIPLEINERLKRLQCLKGAFEAGRSWFDVVLHGGLRHDRPDEIVGEDVRQDFYVNKLGCLASQDIHLHSGLD
jgi:hypothetical protein